MNTSVLKAEGLCKSYGSKQVLQNLDLTIQPGKIYGLIGRNGAGKTTLLGILTAQNTKDGGEVTYGGQPVWENQRALNHICFSRELQPTLFSGQNSLKVRHYLHSAAIFYPNWDQAYADRLLEEFQDNGETVMFAPGEGFYGTPGKGRDEIRLAYILKQEDLRRAMEVLAHGIEAYNARKQ